mmetsp:Transcript_11866/g.41212  ORF Transcript_11866/g.41212 Transcript_11866/m.41212 type:complete len:319 (+) Transcript_11866:45-1001(+)
MPGRHERAKRPGAIRQNAASSVHVCTMVFFADDTPAQSLSPSSATRCRISALLAPAAPASRRTVKTACFTLPGLKRASCSSRDPAPAPSPAGGEPAPAATLGRLAGGGTGASACRPGGRSVGRPCLAASSRSVTSHTPCTPLGPGPSAADAASQHRTSALVHGALPCRWSDPAGSTVVAPPSDHRTSYARLALASARCACDELAGSSPATGGARTGPASRTTAPIRASPAGPELPITASPGWKVLATSAWRSLTRSSMRAVWWCTILTASASTPRGMAWRSCDCALRSLRSASSYVRPVRPVRRQLQSRRRYLWTAEM